jgi:hypothetical protein
MTLLDLSMFAFLGVCVLVWPTQWVTDKQNLWLRIASVALTGAQLVIEGPNPRLLGGYIVAALFALFLIPRGEDSTQPSSVRERDEGILKKRSRWMMVIFSAVCLMTSIAWSLFYLTQTSR